MATLYKSDDTIQKDVHPAAGSFFTLKEMQTAVGGYIEMVPLEPGQVLVCNEEGKLEGLPANREATRLYAGFLMPGDILAGDVLVVSDAELEE